MTRMSLHLNRAMQLSVMRIGWLACSGNIFGDRPSQTVSLEAVASRLPSQLHATPWMLLLCPTNVDCIQQTAQWSANHQVHACIFFEFIARIWMRILWEVTSLVLTSMIYSSLTLGCSCWNPLQVFLTQGQISVPARRGGLGFWVKFSKNKKWEAGLCSGPWRVH